MLGITKTADGYRIEVSRAVDAPAETVWDLFADTERWREWGPPVTDVAVPERRISAGMKGTVQVFSLTWVPFEVVDCENYRWTWRVFGRLPPADGHRVDPIDDDRCRAVLELPLWAPWYVPICLLALYNVATVAESDAA